MTNSFGAHPLPSKLFIIGEGGALRRVGCFASAELPNAVSVGLALRQVKYNGVHRYSRGENPKKGVGKRKKPPGKAGGHVNGKDERESP